MKIIKVATSKREQFVDITSKLQNVCEDENWDSGILTVFVPHTTCGITINENADPDVTTDMTGFLSKLIPQSNTFHHAEGNSDSHIKASLMGFSVSIFVKNKNLQLGRWQAVYLAEFDGARERSLWLKFQITD